MKCEKCVEAGKKSRVNSHGGSRTLMGGGGPYYDEDGEYHHHDPNTITRSYSCTNGHRWSTKGKGTCPTDGCDYGGITQKTWHEDAKPKQDPISIVRAGGLSTGTVPVGGEIIKAYPAKDFYDDSGKLRVGPTEAIPMAVDSTENKDG